VKKEILFFMIDCPSLPVLFLPQLVRGMPYERGYILLFCSTMRNERDSTDREDHRQRAMDEGKFSHT
jgi:hypothetical protein